MSPGMPPSHPWKFQPYPSFNIPGGFWGDPACAGRCSGCGAAGNIDCKHREKRGIPGSSSPHRSPTAWEPPSSPSATTPNPQPRGTNELWIMMASPDLCSPGREHQTHEAPVPRRVSGVPKTLFPPRQGRMEPPHHLLHPRALSRLPAHCHSPGSAGARGHGQATSPGCRGRDPPESQSPESHGAAPLMAWGGSACSWWLFLPWHLHKVRHCPHPGPCCHSLGTLGWWSHRFGGRGPATSLGWGALGVRGGPQQGCQWWRMLPLNTRGKGIP